MQGDRKFLPGESPNLTLWNYPNRLAQHDYEDVVSETAVLNGGVQVGTILCAGASVWSTANVS